METDKTTLADLSIFSTEEGGSVFDRLNLTRTIQGREQLRVDFSNTLTNIDEILGVQQTIRMILREEQHWPMQISNGSIMVIEKFYDTSIDTIPTEASSFTAFNYKLFHGPDYSLVKYSAGHCFDFIKGMQLMTKYFLQDDTPTPLKKLLGRVQQILQKPQFAVVAEHQTIDTLTPSEWMKLAAFIRYHYKLNMHELLGIYGKLDAWYGMAQAVKRFGLVFPEFIQSEQPRVEATGLYHILLEQPVAYDIHLNPDANFLFLTGANMAGKSTFIKAMGIAVFLAHTGMGVPAKVLQLSLFHGLLSNINVVDNLMKGESYFYNEVQRIKATVTKVNDGRKWLILIDELFKGTNVQDAMKCSSTVIEGLLKIRNSLFILSTHLYEIGEDLKKYPNINFKYFETAVSDDQLQFSYQLKDGISNDRLGYLILKREGVVNLLEGL
ncbi:MAG: DNA mismatch repair protein MutS [Chitinophagaceae bacterium]